MKPLACGGKCQHTGAFCSWNRRGHQRQCRKTLNSQTTCMWFDQYPINFNKCSESIMPRPYSGDLRCYFPDYLSALSRTLFLFFWTTFGETAVYTFTKCKKSHLLQERSHNTAGRYAGKAYLKCKPRC